VCWLPSYPWCIPQVEELRLTLLNSVRVVEHLAKLLRSGEEWTRVVAASTLGNLAASGSGAKGVRPQV
jgi:hypothetical protein